MAGVDGGQLIAAWDANAHGAPGGMGCEHWAQMCEWAVAHGADADTHRYEIWLLDAPVARIFRYALNGDGRRHGGAGREAAQAPVEAVMLGELPPPHLRVNAGHGRPPSWVSPPEGR